MQRFYMPDQAMNEIIHVTDDGFFHQISRVLRSRIGDLVILFNGDGLDREYRIEEITKKAITLKKEKEYPLQSEMPRTVILYQSLPNKYEKIEWIIEKWIEIGIHAFYFFRSEHSQKLMITPKKEERFMTIAREALEQCEGSIMPEIRFLDAFDASHVQGEVFILDENGGKWLETSLQKQGVYTLFVGPEGGWSEKERALFEGSGYTRVQFGNRILRTETAAIALGFYFLHHEQ